MVSVLHQGHLYSSTLVNLNWETVTTSSAAEHLCLVPLKRTQTRRLICVSHILHVSHVSLAAGLIICIHLSMCNWKYREGILKEVSFSFPPNEESIIGVLLLIFWHQMP